MDVIEEKIQLIAKDIQESNASTWTITKIVKELNALETKNEKKLREHALKLLKKTDPAAAKIYETFRKMKVYTSKETIENFNRGQIIQSLLKETNIPRSVAEKITIEVENEIKDSRIEFLTAALIRELVNTKLVLYGFEKTRNQYARIGFPIYEINKKIFSQPYHGNELREFVFLNVLPKEAIDLHYRGKIFIEDVGGFSHRPFAYSFLTKKEKTLDKTISQNIKNILKYKNYFSLTPNLRGLCFVVSDFMKTEKNAKSISKKIINSLDLLDDDFSNYLELFTPTYLEEYSENRLKAAAISNNLTHNKKSVFGIDSKYCLKLLNLSNNDLTILNNSKEELISLNKKFFSNSKGIDLFVNINLENLTLDEDIIFNELEEISKVIANLKEKKQELLLEKTYLSEFNIKDMQTGIGLTNLFSLENKLNTQEKEFFKKATREIHKIFKNELVFGLGSNTAKDKFSGTVGREVYSHSLLNFDDCIADKRGCFLAKTKNNKELNNLIDNGIKLINFKSD